MITGRNLILLQKRKGKLRKLKKLSILFLATLLLSTYTIAWVKLESRVRAQFKAERVFHQTIHKYKIGYQAI